MNRDKIYQQLEYRKHWNDLSEFSTNSDVCASIGTVHVLIANFQNTFIAKEIIPRSSVETDKWRSL